MAGLAVTIVGSLTGGGAGAKLVSVLSKTKSGQKVINLMKGFAKGKNGISGKFAELSESELKSVYGKGVNKGWTSVKKYGHTFNTHGAGSKNTKSLTGRAASTKSNQGQWLENQKTSEFLDSLENIKEPTTVSIPNGLGQVITPTGEIIPATKAIVVPSANGIKTAYPIP